MSHSSRHKQMDAANPIFVDGPTLTNIRATYQQRPLFEVEKQQKQIVYVCNVVIHGM